MGKGAAKPLLFSCKNSLIQLLDGQHGIAVGAVCIFCHQCDGCGNAVDADDSPARKSLFIGGGGDGNGGAGGRDGIPVQLQMQGNRKGGAGGRGNDGIIFDLIDAAFGKDKIRRAGCMGDCRACLRLIGGKGEGIACGCGNLCSGIGGAAQIEGSGCPCGTCCPCSTCCPCGTGCARCACSAIPLCATAKILRFSAGMLCGRGEYIYIDRDFVKNP